MARDETYNRLMHTARWLRLRRAVLTAHPLCQRCEAMGRVRAATEVHHATPVERGLGPAEKELLAYDPHNLVALCHECHVEAHKEMGRSGKAQAKAAARERLARFVNKFLG